MSHHAMAMHLPSTSQHLEIRPNETYGSLTLHGYCARRRVGPNWNESLASLKESCHNLITLSLNELTRHVKRLGSHEDSVFSGCWESREKTGRTGEVKGVSVLNCWCTSTCENFSFLKKMRKILGLWCCYCCTWRPTGPKFWKPCSPSSTKPRLSVTKQRTHSLVPK